MKRNNKIEKRMKGLALERDDYTCQNCGSKEKVVVHHICAKRKSDKDSNHKINNLITLCKSCHFKAHNYLSYGIWINHFRKIILSKKPRKDLEFYIIKKNVSTGNQGVK